MSEVRPGHSAAPTQSEVRQMFPALAGTTVFLDNAGGAQVPRQVADRARDYYLNRYVQLGADYRLSREAVAAVDRARRFLELLFHADPNEHAVIVGPSTTALCAMLATAIAGGHDRAERDEIIVCDGGHESNIGPWMRLAAQGYTVRVWHVDPEDPAHPLDLDELGEILNERTRIVAVHHVSNLLGRIEDLPAICELAHAVGAEVIADGVAYAPHRAIDVQQLGVDYYVFSTYKVFGPHLAALCGRREALERLGDGPNHFFTHGEGAPYAFEAGGVCHEGMAALLGVSDLLCAVAGRPTADIDREIVEQVFARFADWEAEAAIPLLEGLRRHDAITLFGPADYDTDRVPTISFTVQGTSSRSIAEALNQRDLGARYGHFYAWRLATEAGLDPDDGVVRISLLHYNTARESERVLAKLERLLQA